MNKVSSWEELSLREKIGQTVICLCETDKHIEMCGSLENFLKKYPIGGIFNNGKMVKGLLTGTNKEFKGVIKEYNKYLSVPLWGVADGGSVAEDFGVSLPPQMAYGAVGDESLAYKAGEFQAEDAKATGIHWMFWPECDLNISQASPVTNTRSVSDKWELTAKIVKAEFKAMADKGIIPTLKHYPGPAYNESMDPHLAPFDNETPMEIWRETYGKMYKELFEAGAPAIMTKHTNLTSYQTEKIDGVYPPATMSYELTTKLLREELGFKGVTVTDALVMGGFGGTKAVDNTIRSFLGGNDVLLWPCYEYIDEMERRILSGEIDEKILDAAVERIWNLKKKFGIIDGVEHTSDADSSYFESKIKEASEKCLTLVQNYDNLLPVSKDKIKSVCIVGVTPDDRQYNALCALKDEFEKYGCKVSMRRNVWTDEIEKATEQNDLIIFALCRTTHRPMGPLEFWGDEAGSIWASNCSEKTKTAVVSFGTPYLYKYYRNSKITYVNAYSPSKQIISAFVKAVFGEISFEGKSSVKL